MKKVVVALLALALLGGAAGCRETDMKCVKHNPKNGACEVWQTEPRS